MKNYNSIEMTKVFGGIYETISLNSTYGQDVDRLAKFLVNEANFSFMIGYEIEYTFTNPVCVMIDPDVAKKKADGTISNEGATERFMLKYFDLRKKTVSNYRKLGRFVKRTLTNHGYEYTMIDSVLDGFKPSALRIMIERLGTAEKVINFINEKKISPFYTVSNIEKLLNNNASGQDSASGQNGTSAQDNASGQDSASAQNDENAKKLAIINAFKLISDTLGENDGTIKNLKKKLIDKGFDFEMTTK